jgi:hypothetical protein
MQAEARGSDADENKQNKRGGVTQGHGRARVCCSSAMLTWWDNKHNPDTNSQHSFHPHLHQWSEDSP